MQNINLLLNNPAVLSAVVGAVVSLIVQLIKKLLAIRKSTWLVRSFLAVLAIISTAVLQATGHSIVDPGLWTGIVQAAIIYLMAHLTHAAALQNPNKY